MRVDLVCQIDGTCYRHFTDLTLLDLEGLRTVPGVKLYPADGNIPGWEKRKVPVLGDGDVDRVWSVLSPAILSTVLLGHPGLRKSPRFRELGHRLQNGLGSWYLITVPRGQESIEQVLLNPEELLQGSSQYE